jgi:hypothetical protein
MSKPSSSKTNLHKLYNVSQLELIKNINVASTPYALTKSLNVNVRVNQEEGKVKALINSGAMGNFVHEELVHKLKLTQRPQAPLPLLDVKGLKIGELRHQVELLLKIRVHEERITMDVAPIRSHQIILGLPWLEAHDLDVTWSTGRIRFGSHHCNTNCLPHLNDVFTISQPTVTLNYLDIEIFATRRVLTACIPTRGSQYAAGWDLYSVESASILPGERKLVDTGISVELPSGVYGRIAPQSGLALKHRITIGAGVIDRDYTGNIKVLIFNQGV